MACTEPRSFRWEYDGDTDSWHAVNNPFRIVAAASVRPDGSLNVATEEEIELFNDGSFCRLLSCGVNDAAPYTHAALIGPDEDEATAWLVNIEEVQP